MTRLRMLATAACCLVLASIAAAQSSPNQQWESGTWGRTTVRTASGAARGGSVRVYVIETETARLELQTSERIGGKPLEVTAGRPITFTIDKNLVSVREAGQPQHTFRLIRRVPKANAQAAAAEQPKSSAPQAPAYTAFGGGHLLKSVSSDGQYVTLEDSSVWEIEPRAWFQTMNWEPDSVMMVRSSPERKDYSYEVANTSVDEGAGARYVPPKQ